MKLSALIFFVLSLGPLWAQSILDTPKDQQTEIKFDYKFNDDEEQKLDLKIPPPNVVLQHKITKNGEIKYSVDYKIGPHYFREIDNSINENGDYILILGGSNTFGQWLKTEQTFPYLIQKAVGKNKKVYNLSCMGCSLSTLYYILTKGEVSKIFKGRKGQIIYNHFDFHINRDNCLPPEVLWSEGEVPYYKIKKDKIIYNQRCKDLANVKMTLWAKNIFTSFPIFKKIVPARSYHDPIASKHIDYTLKLFKGLVNLVGAEKSHILLNPFGLNMSLKKISYFKKKASELKLSLIEYPNKLKETKEYMFSFDQHMNFNGNKLIAYLILEKLALK